MVQTAKSVHPALVVYVEVWVAVKERGLASEMESVSVILGTQEAFARAVLMVTSGRKAPMTAQEPVQHATTHVRNARGLRTTNALTAKLAGFSMTTSVWTSMSVAQSWPVVLQTPTVTTLMDHMNAEAVIRHVLAAWVVVLLGVRNVPEGTD